MVTTVWIARQPFRFATFAALISSFHATSQGKNTILRYRIC